MCKVANPRHAHNACVDLTIDKVTMDSGSYEESKQGHDDVFFFFFQSRFVADTSRL